MSDSNGCPTLAEKLAAVKEELEAQGVQNATSFRVVFAGGETILVASDSNPALSRTDSVEKITPVTSAKAGLV